MSARLGIDVGGTFTNLSLLDERSGNIYAAKIPSTLGDLTSRIFSGLDEPVSYTHLTLPTILRV